MIIAGVDLGGRKAAVSVFQNGELTHLAHFESEEPNLQRALWQTAMYVYGYTRVADCVFIEEPLVGRSVKTSLMVAKMYGAVLAVHGQMTEHNVIGVDVGKWKKEVVGNGNAAKGEVRNWVELNHPAYAELCGYNQDRFDATCIGLYGVAVSERVANLAEF